MPKTLSVALALVLASFSTSAQDETHSRIAANLKRLAQVADAAQDSINLAIKADLRALLDRSDALAANYSTLPMTRVDAPDGAFKLFTWNLPRTDGTHLFEGFLLIRTDKGQALYELRDMTTRIAAPEVPELGPDKWYGALYYEVIPVKKGGRTFYTLLGWKGYSKAETRKVIEVLSFKGGKPRFGAPVFTTDKATKSRVKPMRRVFGYAFNVTMTLRYDPELEAIIMDHLSPPRPDLKEQWAFYGPDMTHDGYFWHKGEWWFGPEIDLRAPDDAKPGR
ncbi:MAG: hypothetical protein ACO1NQ_14385 [Flavobacteriales bacterium]